MKTDSKQEKQEWDQAQARTGGPGSVGDGGIATEPSIWTQTPCSALKVKAFRCRPPSPAQFLIMFLAYLPFHVDHAVLVHVGRRKHAQNGQNRDGSCLRPQPR